MYFDKLDSNLVPSAIQLSWNYTLDWKTEHKIEVVVPAHTCILYVKIPDGTTHHIEDYAISTGTDNNSMILIKR